MKTSFTTAKVRFPTNRVWLARCSVAVMNLALCILLLSSAVRAEVVDSIVASVNNDVITASDLAHAVALNMRLGGTGEDQKTLESDTLEGLITRRLLVQEARRLRFVEVSDEEVNTESDKLRKQFGSDKAFEDFLAEQDMTEQELRGMVRERLLVERFAEKKVGIFVRVSRDEAQSYFEAHAAEYKNKSFQDLQKTIVALLTDQKIKKQMNQYIAELRSRADIRINPH
ncbi:MAG: SurA N-terminal domain-containing protein [Nitrospirota bacterium]